MVRFERSQVWLLLLRSENGPIGAIYGFRFRDRFLYFQISHNPVWDKFSPGTTVIYEAIGKAFAEGASEFGLLQGAGAYKSRWMTGRRSLFMVELLYSGNFGGLWCRMIRGARNLARAGKRFYRKMLGVDGSH